VSQGSQEDSPAKQRGGPEAPRELGAVRALRNAVTGIHEDAALTSDVSSILTRAQVHADDARHILENVPRFWLYRELVQNNVRGVVRQLVPRAAALMDAHAPGAVDALVDDFLRGPGMRSHFMRDIPFELFEWAKERIADDSRWPHHTVTLAAWELFWFRVRVAERTIRPASLADVAPHLPLVLEAPALVQEFACSIHEWDDVDPAPPRVATILLGYRDDKDEPRLFVLTPLAAQIVRELQSGHALAHAIPLACKALGMELSQAVLADSAKLLADLGAAGIILGARG
jgi:hypothetical protein